jgi:hypothetical protein
MGYGEMRTILGPRDNPSVDWETCERKFSEAIREMRPNDFILWAGGDPASAFLAGVRLSARGALNLKWLRWDRRTNEIGERTRHGYYTPVEISV